MLYRSGYEEQVSSYLSSIKVKAEYENVKLKYTKPATNHTYTPDFELPNGILVECKGYIDADTFLKMKFVISQNPDKDIRMCFQNPNNKIRKGSKTTYAMKCDKLGIKWGTIQDLEKWSKELPKK